ncbi:MAG: hypothetical protein OEY14_09320 [Myxococcales bacterium]|nr:hypothetical protein [Myxococcales bacterium]
MNEPLCRRAFAGWIWAASAAALLSGCGESAPPVETDAGVGPTSCAAAGGRICEPLQSCGPGWITAPDTDRCCPEPCEAAGPTPIFVSIVSHNEDDVRYDRAYGSADQLVGMRDAILEIADLTAAEGASYDFQTDWRFLEALRTYETDADRAMTNGKTLLRYLAEDRGVSIEPHSHECATASPAALAAHPEYAGGCNYADVAALIESFGVTPEPVVGGFLVRPLEQASWERFWDPLPAMVHAGYLWQPALLWGGGSPMHTDDPLLTGVWRPAGHADFERDDPSRALPVIGGGAGCVADLAQAIEAGIAPAGKIYTVSLMVFELEIHQNPATLSSLRDRLVAMRPYVASGAVIYASLPEVRRRWVEAYGSEPHLYDLAAAGTCSAP